MKLKGISASLRRRAFTVVMVSLASLAAHGTARAVSITGSQTGPGEWTYDLTFAPEDNYSITQPFTTITLTGASGVTQAFAPTSTDFPNAFIDQINLLWTPQVLNGGTEVQWTHDGGGTGNFGSEQHVFGFRVLAPGAVNGSVDLATDGFSTDFSFGAIDLDITGKVDGPVASIGTPPVPEPATAVLVGLGLTALGARRRKAGGR